MVDIPQVNASMLQPSSDDNGMATLSQMMNMKYMGQRMQLGQVQLQGAQMENEKNSIELGHTKAINDAMMQNTGRDENGNVTIDQQGVKNTLGNTDPMALFTYNNMQQEKSLQIEKMQQDIIGAKLGNNAKQADIAQQTGVALLNPNLSQNDYDNYIKPKFQTAFPNVPAPDSVGQAQQHAQTLIDSGSTAKDKAEAQAIPLRLQLQGEELYNKKVSDFNDSYKEIDQKYSDFMNGAQQAQQAIQSLAQARKGLGGYSPENVGGLESSFVAGLGRMEIGGVVRQAWIRQLSEGGRSTPQEAELAVDNFMSGKMDKLNDNQFKNLSQYASDWVNKRYQNQLVAEHGRIGEATSRGLKLEDVHLGDDNRPSVEYRNPFQDYKGIDAMIGDKKAGIAPGSGATFSSGAMPTKSQAQPLAPADAPFPGEKGGEVTINDALQSPNGEIPAPGNGADLSKQGAPTKLMHPDGKTTGTLTDPSQLKALLAKGYKIVGQ
jgi:hypothetical protein